MTPPLPGFLVFIVLVLATLSEWASSISTVSSLSENMLASRHPHQGKVTPFLPGDPHVPLDDHALDILDSGKPYQTQIPSGSSSRVLVVQDVKATTDVVWELVLDYNHYADMVPRTVESEIYNVVLHPIDENDEESIANEGRQTIYTRMNVGFPMVNLQSFVKNEYYPRYNSLTWTLDYSRKSDFDDSCGYWYVIPHPDKPDGFSRIYHSVDVAMYDWIPTFVVNFMSQQALTEATGWVKKYSEMDFAERRNVFETSTKRKFSSASGRGTPTKSKSAMESQERKRRRWLNMIGAVEASAEQEVDSGNAASGERCSSSLSDNCYEEVNNHSTGKSATREDVVSEAGLTRYILMATVCVLSMYNVHLYFSQQ